MFLVELTEFDLLDLLEVVFRCHLEKNLANIFQCIYSFPFEY